MVITRLYNIKKIFGKLSCSENWKVLSWKESTLKLTISLGNKLNTFDWQNTLHHPLKISNEEVLLKIKTHFLKNVCKKRKNK